MKHTPTDDQLFESWTAEADSAALAGLFDSIAPRLLAVAIHLVGDNGQAEDLVQSVFISLIEKRAQIDPRTPAEAWLMRALRNRAVDLARVRRPHLASRETLEERAGEPDRSIARRELEGQISQAIDELDAPYREVLLARLLHGASAAEIAHLFQRSPGQVRVQLHRGLEMLRSRLPVREALAATLWLAPGLHPRVATTLTSVREAVVGEAGKAAAASAVLPLSPILLAMSKTKLLAAACLAALLAGYAILSIPQSEGIRAVEAAAEVAGAPDPLLDRPREVLNATFAPAEDRRAAQPASRPSQQASAATREQDVAEPASKENRGEILLRVLAKTPFGEPLPGVSIRQISLGPPLPKLPNDPPGHVLERDIGVTGPGGELLVTVPRVDARLVAHDPGVSNLVEGILSGFARNRAEAVIVAGATRPLEGIVTDQDDQPIPGATVTLICCEDFSARFGVPVAMKSQHLESVEADEDGHFEFPRSVESTLTLVKAEALGFEYQLVDAPDRGAASVVIRLPRARQGESVLRGRVVCSDGSSSVGAYVSCPNGYYAVRVTEESGRFELPLQEQGNTVQAVLAGVLPASYEHAPGTPWPDEIVLTLGERALEIQGTVVDEAGKPLKGLHVGVIDGSPFGAVTEPGSEHSRMRRLEDMSSRTESAQSRTDGNGSFRIEGLLARPYRLLVQEPETLRAVISAPIQAGQSGARLVLDRSGPSGAIAGRVTDKAGVPLAGVSVSARRSIDFDGHYNAEANRVAAPWAATDADGRFRLPQSAYEGTLLACNGGLAYVSSSIPLETFDDPLDIQLTLARNCSFLIEWSGGGLPDGAMGMRLEDPDGQHVRLWRSMEGGIVSMDSAALGGPATPVYFVPEGSYQVVVLGEDGELTRFPIVLEGAEQQTIIH